MSSPKRPTEFEVTQLCNRNDGVVWQEIVARKGWAEEKAKPTIKQGPTPNKASHKGKRNQKMVKNGWQTMQTNCGRRMSSKQILDAYRREARARPGPHQLVLSQYRTK